MELINFDKCEATLGTFGGNAGKKIEIIYNNARWIVKYPQSTKGMDNVLVSYTNSPLSEYIGSHIYEMLGIPVHETLLGERNGKVVVACKNFLEDGDRLIDFKHIKNMYDPNLEEITERDTSNGSSGGTDLSVILEEIENNIITSKIEGIKERFWDMFVVDALIANGDRNNENWGLIQKKDGYITLSPVYDNGNSFNNKMDLDKLKRIVNDDRLMRDNAINNVISYYTIENKKIHPFHFLKKENVPEKLLDAIEEYNYKVSIKKISDFISEIPEEHNGKKVISPEYKEYLINTISQRDKQFQEILKLHDRKEFNYKDER